MITYLTQGMHDVDRVSLGDTHELPMGTHARTLTVKSGEVKHEITLFASDPKFLEFKREG